MAEINEKWGFGMAPVKQKTDQDRFESIDKLLEFRSSPSLTTDKPTLATNQAFPLEVELLDILTKHRAYISEANIKHPLPRQW